MLVGATRTAPDAAPRSLSHIHSGIHDGARRRSSALVRTLSQAIGGDGPRVPSD
jgi:hypothetical protein